MTDARRSKLRSLAITQIADAIESDLQGETIMKEVWEECANDAEVKAVECEMKEIVSLLRMRVRSLR